MLPDSVSSNFSSTSSGLDELLNQSWVYSKDSISLGVKKKWNWSSILPQVLKADSEVTVDVEIASISQAIMRKYKVIGDFVSHHFKMSKWGTSCSTAKW